MPPKAKSPPPPPPDRTPTLRELLLVPLADIIADDANHRLTRPDDAEKIAALTASMRAHGLEQPILVWRGVVRKNFHLVFGFRRLEAAAALGWKVIPAQVMGHIPDPREIQELRAVENLDRSDLNPAEEAFAIMGLVEAHHGRVETAAAAIGRSERWVRDRLYVAKLTPKVRGLLLAGTFNLGQARELTKVPDPKTQEALAARIVHQQTHGYNVSIEEMQLWLEEEQRPLDRVQWSLTVAFAGKPACSACPRNTANDVDLFGTPKGDARCADPVCYQVKVRRVGEEEKKIADKLQARVKAKKLAAEDAASIDLVREITPAFMEPAAIQKFVRATVVHPATKNGAPKAAPAQKKSKAPSEKERRQEALLNWARAFREWRGKILRALQDAICSEPHLVLTMLALEKTNAFLDHDSYDAPFSCTGPWKEKTEPLSEVPISPALDRLLTCVAARTYDSLLEIASAPRSDFDRAAARLIETPFGPELAMRIAKAFLRDGSALNGIKTPPAFEDFLPADLKPAQSSAISLGEPVGIDYDILFHAICAERIASNKIKSPFAINGKLFVVTGASSCGNDINQKTRTIDLTEAFDDEDWKGKTRSYGQKMSGFGQPGHSFYFAQRVTCGKDAYVLGVTLPVRFENGVGRFVDAPLSPSIAPDDFNQEDA